jgi:hypothetical protein
VDALIFRPNRSLWTPPAGLWRPRPGASAFLRPVGAWRGLRFASGETLAIFVPSASTPPATNYATFNVRNGHLVLEFDTTTQEAAVFAGRLPRNYSGGNLVVSVSWMAATATSGTIGWGVTFERDNAANNDLDADAWATEQIITAVTVDAASGKVTTSSVTCTAGAAGTASMAAGEDFRLRVRRDVANDTATGDAQLLSVEVKEA